ncbi:chemotaxis protein CheW [Nitrosococcus wardiae]|nr:chemotaxis protein CheW [Nitrosococcus wardiae]
MTKNQLSLSKTTVKSYPHDDPASSHPQSGNLVPSILIPLQDQTLLLPRTTIAEVIPFIAPDPLQDAPQWLYGTLRWREQLLLLISFEALQRKPAPPLSKQTRIVVFNSVTRLSKRKFYALIIQGIPQLILARADNLSAFPKPPNSPLLHCCAEINQCPVVIPNLGYLEEMLQRCVTG